MSKIAAIAFIAVLAGYGIRAVAQREIDVRPAAVPVGTSSSNGVSFAWFYESSERAVYVCRVDAAPRDKVACSAKAMLP
jgi:predicted GNAT superfamily acetyltransferase